MSYNRTHVLRLVFSTSDGINPPYTTKLGTFTNAIVKIGETPLNQHRIANRLKNNCLQSELKMLVGWCIDNDSFDTMNVPVEKVQGFTVRSWSKAIKQTVHNAKEMENS